MLKKILYIGLTLIMLVSTLAFTTGCNDGEGELYPLGTAYEQGILTVEDLEFIKECKTNSVSKRLSKKESLKIRTEFAKTMGKALEKEIPVDNVGLTYYCKIDGYKILEIAENMAITMIPGVYYDYFTQYIGGVEFEHYPLTPYFTWFVWKG